MTVLTRAVSPSTTTATETGDGCCCGAVMASFGTAGDSIIDGGEDRGKDGKLLVEVTVVPVGVDSIAAFIFIFACLFFSLFFAFVITFCFLSNSFFSSARHP